MKTHTPGPWRYEQETKTIRSVPANYWLATMDSWDGSINNEANARLIAAAPELLAALRRVIDSPFEPDKWHLSVENAIAKAQGGQS